MTAPDLLPCPFCGGEAERIELTDGENMGGDVICCTKCQASSHVEFGRKENLVSAWNTRATPAALSPIAGRTLDEWSEFARRDDCLERMVPSDLRQLLAALRAIGEGRANG